VIAAGGCRTPAPNHCHRPRAGHSREITDAASISSGAGHTPGVALELLGGPMHKRAPLGRGPSSTRIRFVALLISPSDEKVRVLRE
jgi:hypothetical protein